ECCLTYGNLAAYSQWMGDIKGRVEVNDSLGLFTFYADKEEYGTAFIGGISCSNIGKIIRRGHVNSLKFIQSRMSPAGFKHMCTLRNTFYALSRSRHRKALDFLIESEVFDY